MMKNGWYYFEAERVYKKITRGKVRLTVTADAWPAFKNIYQIPGEDIKGTIIDD